MAEQRRTITVNIPVSSPLLIAAEARAAAERRPISVTIRELAEEALAREAELRAEIAEVHTKYAKTSELLDCSGSICDKLCLALDKARAELEKERFAHKGTRADLAGDTEQLLAARVEISQLKQSLANANSASTALSTELDRANEELERLREEFRTEHFRLKCSQEALAEAKAELETLHAARRAEAEAEDHAAERARLEEAEVDRSIIVAGLLCLRHRAAALMSRERVEDEV